MGSLAAGGPILERVVERAMSEVVPLLKEMVSCDTTIAEHDDPPREDAKHQELLASYIRDFGAEVELFEPAVDEFKNHPMYRPNQTFEGRPILWGKLRGTEGGRSLLFNGHMDTVPADPVTEWTHEPWGGDIEDGALYGRGACDMKGGIAAALAVGHALAAANARLEGDVFFNVVPFEEVNGMGTIATVLRGYRADGAVCCEPTELNTLIACRGILLAELAVEGRSAHAEIIQPHHSVGGGVSAIDRLLDVLMHLRGLNEDWRTRPDKQHSLLSTPYVLTTLIRGGAFASNWPAEARATLNVCYLPGEADDQGYGRRVQHEIERSLATYASTDSWLSENPPALTWLCDFPPGELPHDHVLVRAVDEAARREGIAGTHVVGFDTWADQVSLIREGQTPCVCFGPGSIHYAHAVDEHVRLTELEKCVRVYASLALGWARGA